MILTLYLTSPEIYLGVYSRNQVIFGLYFGYLYRDDDVNVRYLVKQDL